MDDTVDLHRLVKAVEMAEGVGATVRRVFPTDHLQHVDPFVLLDEFTVTPPAFFPDHAHGGFEAVTYMLGGAFRHRDNLGNDEVVSAGGVQRFTAGKRIVHAELPGSDDTSRGLQLWVNLPRQLKDSEPEYQSIPAERIPEMEGDGLRVRTVVGKGSAVKLHTEVRYVDVALEAGAVYEHDVPAGWNGIVYVLEGSVLLKEVEVLRAQAAIIKGGRLRLSTEEPSRVAIMAGKPHEEPIRQRGSFVA